MPPRVNWKWLRDEVEWRLEGVGIKDWGAMYLIGSRAAGTHHSDSDWDVAVIVPSRFRTPYYQNLLDNMIEEEYMEQGEEDEEYRRSNVIDIFLVAPRNTKNLNSLRRPYIEWPHL
jgi:predicted nucleotidyltransferase